MKASGRTRLAPDRAPDRGCLRLGTVLVALCCVAVVGCSSGKPAVPFGTVRGRVTLDGKPLPDAAVAFEPENGRPSYGVTVESGEYSLLYRGKPWGAIVGRHTVRITTEAFVSEAPGAASATIRAELLPAKYHTKSTLRAEVAQGENTIDFDLQSK